MSALRLALFGHPVSHSPSPRVHQAFAAQFGIDADYRLVDSLPDAFPAALEAFRAEGGAGCNVTLPLKMLACDLASERSPRARLARAANTLVFGEGGATTADNTDGEGLVRDLRDNAGYSVAGTKILLLGAGGAAAGVLGALLGERPSEVVIVNRTVERAEELARRHAALGRLRCLAPDALEECGEVDFVIEATSMGHSGARPAIAPAAFSGARLCYSLNYGPAARPWAELAGEAGTAFRDGLGMLVEQAACSFEIWTGRRPDTGAVLEMLTKTAR